MSTKGDGVVCAVDRKNIKGLVSDLYFVMEKQLRDALAGSEFEEIRPADGKVFMMITRQTFSLSEYARITGISRQAIHKSITRLVEHEVISLVSAPNSKRDKVPKITDKGEDLHEMLAVIFKDIEQGLIDKVGSEKFSLFKSVLEEIVC